MTYKLRDKIQLILKQLEAGGTLTTKPGHILAIADGGDEPGFLMNKYDTNMNVIEGEQWIMQIGSETAWMYLIAEAKRMTREDCIKLIMDTTNVNSNSFKKKV